MAHACAGLTWGVCGVVATCAILSLFALLYCVCCFIICSKSRWCRNRDKRTLARRRPCRTVIVGVQETEDSSEATDHSHVAGVQLPTSLLVSSPPAYEEALTLPLPGSCGVTAADSDSHQLIVNDTLRMSVQRSLAALTGGHVTPATLTSRTNDTYLRLPSYEEYCSSDNHHAQGDSGL